MNRTDALTTEIGNAFTAALEFMADLHGLRPHDVHEDDAFRAAVWTETVATLGCRPGIAEILATRYAPTRCCREGCVNEASDKVSHPRDTSLTFCSGPCRQWYRREQVRAWRAERHLVAV